MAEQHVAGAEERGERLCATVSLTMLTPREVGILRLIARGMSNRRIARELDISEKTVKNHLSAIYVKIGATDRTQAALYAVQAGMVDQRSALSPLPASWAPVNTVPRQLTPREVGILRLIAWGMSNRRIARNLDISEKTVKNHLSAIYVKIGATDRTQAALYALRTGLTCASG